MTRKASTMKKDIQLSVLMRGSAVVTGSVTGSSVLVMSRLFRVSWLAGRFSVDRGAFVTLSFVCLLTHEW